MESKNTSYDFVQTELDKLNLELAKQNININIHLGSEVFFKFNLTKILDNPLTTIGNSKYMLIEFQRLSFPEGYEDEIFKLQLQGITPIIAHPERYRPIQKDLNILKRWIERGYLIQIDCGSILGNFGKETQICSTSMVENELCHIIGSDAHNDRHRNFLLEDTYKILDRKIGLKATNILKNNSKSILSGEKCSRYYLESNKNIFTKMFGKYKKRMFIE